MSEPDLLGREVGSAFYGRFKDLNPLQRLAVEPILRGSDVLLRAATASGKTEAATAPLTQRYLDDLRNGGVTILVVSPTKALVNDLARRLEGPLEMIGLRVGVRHGDHNQLKNLRPPEVIVTTPESFDIIVGQRLEVLRGVKAVVFDEIHQLYNTQRGMQVAIALHRLERWLGTEVQVVGLSATVGAATDVWQFFRPGRSVQDIEVAGARELHHQIRLNVSIDDLVELLQRVTKAEKVLVFANSRHECDVIADRLRQTGTFGEHVYAHHSSLDKTEREHVEDAFANANAAVCVATSTLELGIDIGSIDFVVLYGAPSDWASVAQRTGRGNRRGSVVEALFCVPTPRGGSPSSLVDELGFQALLLEWEQAGASSAPRQIYGAAAQQLCSEVHSVTGFLTLRELLTILHPWDHLNDVTTTAILDELVERDILQRHPAYHRYGAGEGLHDLAELMEIWSNLTGGGIQVPVQLGERRIGGVSVRNVGKLSPGVVFLLAGRRFRVASADQYSVRVQSTTAAPTVKLDVDGSAPVPSMLRAEWIRRVIENGEFANEVRPSASAEDLRSKVERLKELVDPTTVPVAVGDGLRYLTFAGGLINSLIGQWFTRGTARAGEFTLTTSAAVDWTTLPTMAELTSGAVPHEKALTTWQEFLPDGVRDNEARSWLRASRVADSVLNRLRTATVKHVQPEALQPFSQ